jgi:hypothetical protein
MLKEEMSKDQTKIKIDLIPKLEQPEKITQTRKNICQFTLDLETGFITYDLKIDYDKNTEVEIDEELKTVNLSYRKYEEGIIHISDVTGLWATTSPEHKVIEEKGEKIVSETYTHYLEIGTKSEPLMFTMERGELKTNYNILKDFFMKFKK